MLAYEFIHIYFHRNDSNFFCLPLNTNTRTNEIFKQIMATATEKNGKVNKWNNNSNEIQINKVILLHKYTEKKKVNKNWKIYINMNYNL